MLSLDCSLKDQYPHCNEDTDPVAMKLDVINTDFDPYLLLCHYVLELVPQYLLL
jgi:hypothetical protein